MPVAVHISATKMSQDDYRRVMDELQATAGEPEGRMYHAAYGDDDVEMFEVWATPEEFDAYQDRRFAVIQGAGMDGGIVRMHPLHSPHPD